jgi:2-keto-4-pentenoate hydratase
MTNVWDDPRIQRGMKAQLARRGQSLAAGAKPLGWKVGFGAPAALEKLAIAAPLIGFMTDRSVIASGAEVSFAGWEKPIAEPEIAVHMGADLGPGADRAGAAAAIAAIGPAIELVDLNEPPEEPEKILSGNIYHRHVVLGPAEPWRSGARPDGLIGQIKGHVVRNGSEVAKVTDLQANTGDIIGIVAHVASMLAAFGERLRAGEVIICGSVVAPIGLDRHDRSLGFTFDPGSAATVKIAN